MTDCIFCKIVKGDIPSAKILENDKIIAFLDIAPANKGHVLILPKDHFETYLDVPDEVFHEINQAIKKIIKAISQALGNKGYNLLMNNYKVAGQLVPHAHMHIIPRFENDKVKLNWKPHKYQDNEMDDLLGNIKKFM